MRSKVVNKLMVNWAASFLSVVILLSMVAAPALAMVAANSVDSSLIADGSILTRDIKRDAVTSSRIKDYSIRKEDIHSGSINKYKLTSDAVNTYKIEDGSVETQDIANGTITNADIASGASISESKISYDTTKTRKLAISGYTVQPYISISSSDSIGGDSDGNIWATGSGPQFFAAPVHLPEGATVVNFSARLYDNSASHNPRATLVRKNSENSAVQMASAKTGGQSTSWQTKTAPTISSPVIDNSNAYVLYLYLHGDAGNATMFSHAEITYEYSSPGH